MTNPIECAPVDAEIFVNPRAYAEPSEWLRRAAILRGSAPVIHVSARGFGPFWAVLGHRELIEVGRRAETFVATEDFALMREESASPPPFRRVVDRMLPTMSGEEHRAHRRAIAEWFKASKQRGHWTAWVADAARATIGELRKHDGECDLVADVVREYPVKVLARVFGIPEAEESEFVRLVLALSEETFGEASRLSGGDGPTDVFLLAEAQEYFERMARARRASPGNDVVSHLARADVGGAALADQVVAGHCKVLATAGHHTITFAIAGGVELFATHPGEFERCRANAALLDNAIEEILRRTSPTRQFLRHVKDTSALGGAQLPAGSRVLLSFPAADHDPSIFEGPTKFDVTRHNAVEHVAFGVGPHFCVGAQLARTELRGWFDAFLASVDSLELTGVPRYNASLQVGGVTHLPIRAKLSR